MFSAPKFVVAGVIVALFGGFLLAGILTTRQTDGPPAAVTTSSSPTTTDTLLPGVTLSVEEVEPGVYRVLNDGVRDLVAMTGAERVVAGTDGSIWLNGWPGFYRLGTDGSYDWPNGERSSDFEVAPDGVVWTYDSDIRSFDGASWTLRKKRTDTDVARWNYPGDALTVTTDGTVWTSWPDPDGNGSVVARFAGDGWAPLDQTFHSAGQGGVAVLATEGGDVWAAQDYHGPLLRYHDGAWVPMTPEDVDVWAGQMDVGPDGAVWLVANLPEVGMVDGCTETTRCLMRLDTAGWQAWDGPDAQPFMLWVLDDFVPLRVTPDGSVWLAPQLEAAGGAIARFDGTDWRGYLPGRFVMAMDVATDGSVWATASHRRLVDAEGKAVEGELEFDLYIITPEAAAATG